MSLTNAHLKQRIHRLVAKWRPILGMESWQVDVLFDETDALGTCEAKPRYEEAILRFNLPRIRAELPNTIAALEELVVHECVHCIIWKNSELAVSRVTRSLLRAKDAA